MQNKDRPKNRKSEKTQKRNTFEGTWLPQGHIWGWIPGDPDPHRSRNAFLGSRFCYPSTSTSLGPCGFFRRLLRRWRMRRVRSHLRRGRKGQWRQWRGWGRGLGIWVLVWALWVCEMPLQLQLKLQRERKMKKMDEDWRETLDSTQSVCVIAEVGVN